MPSHSPSDKERVQAQRRIGVRIREARIRARLTLREAAEHLGLDDATIVRLIEEGNRGIDALDLWAMSQLMGRPMEHFVNPSFREQARSWPMSYGEWLRLADGDADRARAFFYLDTALKARKPVRRIRKRPRMNSSNFERRS